MCVCVFFLSELRTRFSWSIRRTVAKSNSISKVKMNNKKMQQQQHTRALLPTDEATKCDILLLQLTDLLPISAWSVFYVRCVVDFFLFSIYYIPESWFRMQ